MPDAITGINSLRSFVFVRRYRSQTIEKTDIRVQKESGNLKTTAINTELTPREIQFISSLHLIEAQKSKNPQDRLIDFFT
jgi:hypothetical protein